MQLNYEQFDDLEPEGVQSWIRRKPSSRKRQYSNSYNGRRLPPRYTQWSVDDWYDVDANDTSD